MDATDDFATAFERHARELAEVSKALKELAIDQSDSRLVSFFR